MKKAKKHNEILPEVNILGDLQDVKNLVAGVNRKKAIVVFRDGEQGTFYLEIEGEIQQILQEDIKELEKEYRLIFFSFFPSQKISKPVIEEQSAGLVQEKHKKKSKGEKKTAKKKSHKEKKKGGISK